MSAVVAQLRRWLHLEAEATAGPGWARVHRVAMVTMVLLVVAGLVIPRLAGDSPAMIALRTMALLLMTTALGIYLIERIVSLVYERPLRRTAIAASTISRHPLLLWLLAVALVVSAVLAPQTLLLVQAPLVPAGLRAATIALAVLNSIPLWLLITHPLETWRQATALRGAEGRWHRRGGRVLGRLGAFGGRVRDEFADLRQLVAGIGRRRPPAPPPEGDEPPGRPYTL